MTGAALTTEQLADALGCFWNAALGEAHNKQDSTAFAVTSCIVEGLNAISMRLQELSTSPAAPTPPVQPVASASEALRLLAAEDRRQAKLHELLETIREQIRVGVAPEHRPDGLFQNIQDAVYAMRGRTPLMNDAAITSTLLPVQPVSDEPVAWRFRADEADGWRYRDDDPGIYPPGFDRPAEKQPLYTRPQPAKEVAEALRGMLAHSCVADAGGDMKTEEDHEAERRARAALASLSQEQG